METVLDLAVEDKSIANSIKSPPDLVERIAEALRRAASNVINTTEEQSVKDKAMVQPELPSLTKKEPLGETRAIGQFRGLKRPPVEPERAMPAPVVKPSRGWSR
jgi:hypothetical protein